uniref:65-kDa microtubule-associated protein 6-like n=1 Tax=Nelumbo nucifera TaxID=4432 RepID=A0A822YL96_NELNU|nr:TPA_asm: hypothetical protein HUJ06_011202 [Nelumbo nucifera]
MQVLGSPTSVRIDISCGSLLRELQHIWDEIGESEADKERMLLEIERECLQVYRRKVDEASNTKARLHQSVAAKEAELATLMAALGELNLHSQIQIDKKSSSLKEQLASITPLVEDLRMKKEERMKQFADIKAQIEKITGEISGYTHLNGVVTRTLNAEEQDLSLRKLTGYEQSTNISNSTLEGLDKAILKLKAERKSRIQKLKDIVASLFELWNLMDSPQEERNLFRKVTFILESPEPEIAESGLLSLEIIDKAASEVERLTKLKASRMKELVMKKRSELEEICRKAHIEPDTSTAAEKANALIDSGLVDPSELLANIEVQITKAKDEAMSRKEIMDRIDRWLAACEEENWLEDYNQDENRYTAGRGVHINLKRAEKARVSVTKIPAMVENLINRTLAWEDSKKMLFLYDGVRLISILEDYKLTRRLKEEEKKRYRDQKKLQDLLLTEKEAMYGSKPSPKRSNSFKKPNGYRANGNGSMTPTPRRLSLGSATPELLTPRSYSGRQNGYFKETRRLSTAPLNFVAISKEDTMSYASVCGSDLGSPHG